MTDDRRDNYNDDEHFQRKCEAAIWFVFVDGHIQHCCSHTDEDTIGAENWQGGPPRNLDFERLGSVVGALLLALGLQGPEYVGDLLTFIRT